ncbi:MAG TPA: sulfite exporter TauE/SafE family protein [Rhodospirillales bacterium]|jgi:hypothetical protein|nr:sulfite exporter TauE/SafE family protein [Rhodospirillales bacterium]HJO69716.1 sulfite exporter TauE/SafE family protein [Rhodospirillales bacterium]
MFDAPSLIAIFATFLVAGAVKGVIGLGLPILSLGLLTAAIGLPQAMALLLVPALVTNVWQALSGGSAKAILRRTWPFLVMATVTVWIGTAVLTRADLRLLSGLLGLLLVVYSLVSLAGFRLSISTSQEVWAGPAMGTVNGILAGMTGSFGVPGVLYLQAIGLPRDMLIQSMGMLFAASTLALAVALQGVGLLSQELGLASSVALAPALAGMVAGRRLRGKIPEQRFRQVFFASLLLLGAYIIAQAI